MGKYFQRISYTRKTPTRKDEDEDEDNDEEDDDCKKKKGDIFGW